jgi:hypothetical protein
VIAAALEPEGASPSRAPRLLVASAGPATGESLVSAIDGATGEVVEETAVPGSVAFLLAAPGGRTAYVVVERGEVEEAGRPRRVGRFSLSAVDLDGGGAGGAVSVEAPVLGASLDAGGGRVYLGMADKVRSFRTNPLRSSWQLRSPGPNHLILPVGTGADLLVARGSEVALLSPDRLPGRDPNTGSFPRDDAFAVVDLPFAPAFLAASTNGAVAAALDAPGGRLALVDLAAGKLLGVREVEGIAAAVFPPGRPSIVLLGRAQGEALEMAFAPPSEARAPGPSRAEDAGASAPVDAGGVAPPASRSEDLRPAGSAPPPPAPAESPAAPAPPGETSPGAPPPAPPEEAAAPAAETAPARPPAAAAAPAAGAVPGRLRGTVTGDLAAVAAVVVFGPNSLLREHARAAPAADGSFDLPLPPPGRYRILLAGAGGAQLAYAPAYYQIEVGGSGIAGLDFMVTGRVAGSLRP